MMHFQCYAKALVLTMPTILHTGGRIGRWPASTKPLQRNLIRSMYTKGQKKSLIPNLNRCYRFTHAHKITNAVIRGQQSMGDHHVKSRDDLLYGLFQAGHPPVRDHLLHLQEHACVIARQGQTRAQVRVIAAECSKKDAKRECKSLHMQAN